MNENAKQQAPEEPKGIAVGNRERRYLSETIRIEEELIPAFVRPMLILVAVMVLSFLLWAGVTDLTEVATAPGEIIPSSKVQVVQHLDGGAVEAVEVEEHQLVKKGQVLVRIDGSQAMSDLRQMETRLASLRLRAERLRATTEGREPDFSPWEKGYPGLLANQREIYDTQLASRDSTLEILDRQIDQKSGRLELLAESLKVARRDRALTDELVEMRKDLAERKLIKRTVMLETQRAKVTAEGEVQRLKDEIHLISKELEEARSRRRDAENQLLRDAAAELGTVEAEVAEAEEGIERLRARVERLLVRSPAHGYVHDLQAQTVGQVIQPGGLMMQIVPDVGALEAEVRISPRDVGHVQVGQPVNLQVTSYDYTRFGFAKGTLKRISPTNVVGEDGEAFFRGWVAVEKPYVGDDPKRYVLQPGMAVEARILTGEKTLLAYLLKPVTDVVSRSFSER